MTDTNKCYKAIDRTCQALFDLNMNYGQLLDLGLEDRCLELYELLNIQLKQMTPNTSGEM